MQIPEMFSYVGMKDTKVPDEVLLIHTQKYKMEERVKTEHNLVWTFLYLFASFPFCIYLYFYFQYLSTFKILKILFVLKYNKYHIL